MIGLKTPEFITFVLPKMKNEKEEQSVLPFLAEPYFPLITTILL